MRLLLWLTLGYTAVLVLSLAVGLILVWTRLRGIDRQLAAAEASLERVRSSSEGLDDGIRPLREGLLESIEALQSSAADLRAAGEAVGAASGNESMAGAG